MIYIVQLTGPYDYTFVGPFKTLDKAEHFAKAHTTETIDTEVITGDQFFEQVFDAGCGATIISPEDYESGTDE